jgi:ammonia channel protein AmtB
MNLKDNEIFVMHGCVGIWGTVMPGNLGRPSLIRHLITDSWYGGIGAEPKFTTLNNGTRVLDG